MKLSVYLVLSLLLTSCGYHLVGQDKPSMIPESVTTASLQAMQGKNVERLLSELTQQWQQKDFLPALTGNKAGEEHITLRIEQAKVSFTASAFDASGLAIQYRLTISAELNMYQLDSKIWGSGLVLVDADVFEGSDLTVTEAERERLTVVLNQRWARDALNRMSSGF